MQTENLEMCDQLRTSEREKMTTIDDLQSAELEIKDLKIIVTKDSEKSDGETKYQKLKVFKGF